MLVAMIALILVIVLPLLKVKALDKFAGIIAFCICGLLVVACIFMFLVVPTFFAANGYDKVPDNAAIGAGWVIGGIIAIIAGAFAALPTIFALLGKK